MERISLFFFCELSVWYHQVSLCESTTKPQVHHYRHSCPILNYYDELLHSSTTRQDATENGAQIDDVIYYFANEPQIPATRDSNLFLVYYSHMDIWLTDDDDDVEEGDCGGWIGWFAV